MDNNNFNLETNEIPLPDALAQSVKKYSRSDYREYLRRKDHYDSLMGVKEKLNAEDIAKQFEQLSEDINSLPVRKYNVVFLCFQIIKYCLSDNKELVARYVKTLCDIVN